MSYLVTSTLLIVLDLVMHRSDFVVQDATYQDTINLFNSGPSVSVIQDDGHSFRKIVNFTGSAHDGQLAGFYATDASSTMGSKRIHSLN